MFANRVLSFDMACMKVYVGLLARSRAAGLAIETADAFIAIIALFHAFVQLCSSSRPHDLFASRSDQRPLLRYTQAIAQEGFEHEERPHWRGVVATAGLVLLHHLL